MRLRTGETLPLASRVTLSAYTACRLDSSPVQFGQKGRQGQLRRNPDRESGQAKRVDSRSQQSVACSHIIFSIVFTPTLSLPGGSVYLAPVGQSLVSRGAFHQLCVLSIRRRHHGWKRSRFIKGRASLLYNLPTVLGTCHYLLVRQGRRKRLFESTATLQH